MDSAVAPSSVIPLVGDHYHLKGRLRHITQTYVSANTAYTVFSHGTALAYPAIVIY